MNSIFNFMSALFYSKSTDNKYRNLLETGPILSKCQYVRGGPK
jgi:hypothetical protein